ncbi:hypothetical protein HJC23_011234 [Cyclotella cryptica]|uniref:Uncharacterized protein n=1 Tax=Cyclotella cryptica TaxID=29204 RepID=A0ABD3QXJ3_9STRA|eukprot:CCRYP_001608-RA/>CCRYP_001608-RA protein AED:0.00 eAED:0.00 QI:230/1/1/1/0/0/2/323/124
MEDGGAPMTVAQRIAALQKQSPGNAPHPPPQQCKSPSQVSSRIAELQKTVEPAFLSGREKSSSDAKNATSEAEVPREEVHDTKAKKFKPPPGAVQVMLPFAAGPPSLTRKQRGEKEESAPQESE